MPSSDRCCSQGGHRSDSHQSPTWPQSAMIRRSSSSPCIPRSRSGCWSSARVTLRLGWRLTPPSRSGRRWAPNSRRSVERRHRSHTQCRSSQPSPDRSGASAMSRLRPSPTAHSPRCRLSPRRAPDRTGSASCPGRSSGQSCRGTAPTAQLSTPSPPFRSRYARRSASGRPGLVTSRKHSSHSGQRRKRSMSSGRWCLTQHPRHAHERCCRARWPNSPPRRLCPSRGTSLSHRLRAPTRALRSHSRSGGSRSSKSRLTRPASS